MVTKYFVGVDGGGTKSKLILQDEAGHTLASTRGGPGSIRLSVSNSWNSINDAFEQALSEAGINKDDPNIEFHAAMGLAGTEIREASQEFLSTPHPFKTLLLESDAHTACIGAHNGSDGAIIIIGTGVIGYEIVRQQVVRIGGWGFPQGDEGGGAWIGLQAIRYTMHMIDGRIKPTPLLEAIFEQFGRDAAQIISWSNNVNSTKFGEFAPLVVDFAKQGAPLASKIMTQAGNHINEVAHALINRSLEPNVEISLFGGIAPFVEPYLDESVRQLIIERKHDATLGAIIMLRQHFGMDILT